MSRHVSAIGLGSALFGLGLGLAGSPALGQDDGEALFERRCAVCHGALPEAPSAEALGRLDREQFLSGIEQHESAGGLVASLSEAQIVAIYDALSLTDGEP